MAIEILPNQPVLFRPPTWQEPCPCDNCEPDCMQVEHDDYIYAQVKSLPCGDDLTCGDFDEIGTELVTNGNFDTDLTDWSGVNWAWEAGGRARHTSGSTAPLVQTIGAGLDDSFDYYILFTIFGMTTGTVDVYLGGVLVSGYNFDSAYILEMKAGSANEELRFVPSTDFDGAIDAVSVKRIAPCWTKTDTLSTTFSKTFNNVCFSGAAGESITSDNLSTVTGQNYVVQFTISNYALGELSLDFGTQTAPFTYSSNGTKYAYASWLTAAGLSFYSTDGFSGCVSDVHIYLLREPLFFAVDPETDEGIPIAGFTTSIDDRAILKFQPLELLAYGCYKICVIDQCGPAYTETLLLNGNFDTDLADWVDSGNNWAWNAAGGGVAKYTVGGTPGSLSQEFKVDDTQVCARIIVRKLQGSPRINTYVLFSIIDSLGNVDTQLRIDNRGVYSICGTGVKIEIDPGTSSNISIEIDNVSVRATTDCDTCNSYDYCSNCINFKEDLGTCSLLIESYNKENSFGFVFNDNSGTNIFKLSHRIASKLWHPTYPEESNDYTFSDGKTSDTFAQSDKVWTLGIDPESERAFDVIRLQKRSDHFVITDVNESREMWAEKGDLNPDWADGGCRAPANIKVKLKTSTLFNNLCSQ